MVDQKSGCTNLTKFGEVENAIKLLNWSWLTIRIMW